MDIFDTMTDDEIEDYIKDNEADAILSSIDYQERNYVDCYLPA